jgi:hypothetical protein
MFGRLGDDPPHLVRSVGLPSMSTKWSVGQMVFVQMARSLLNLNFELRKKQVDLHKFLNIFQYGKGL